MKVLTKDELDGLWDTASVFHADEMMQVRAGDVHSLIFTIEQLHKGVHDAWVFAGDEARNPWEFQRLYVRLKALLNEETSTGEGGQSHE